MEWNWMNLYNIIESQKTEKTLKSKKTMIKSIQRREENGKAK